jgi:hypothetical protein
LERARSYASGASSDSRKSRPKKTSVSRIRQKCEF